MKRILSVFFRSGVLLCALVIFWVNLRLYLRPANQPDFAQVPPNAVAHLAWIRGALDGGAAEDMQQLFPEGYFFSYELYGLSWVELGLRSRELRDAAIREARWALDHIESAAGKSAFPPSLPPGHGMFYSGWRNHLQAGIVLLSGDEAELTQLRSRCDELVAALEASAAWPWLASYPNQVWPCDTPPGIHAMRVCDHVSGENRYAEFVETWLDAVAEGLDPEFGMISHLAIPDSGKPLGPPRGTSQTIILRFLADIDPAFAADQYRRFQKHFHDSVLRIPAIREYPHGVLGAGDVDSGPLIAGISGSSTVLGMGVAQVYGDHEFARAISQAGETLGFPFGFEERRYLGGVLPLGDAFVVHASTARPWLDTGSGRATEGTPVSKIWRWGIHLLSLLLGAGLFFIWRLSSFSEDEESSEPVIGST